MTSLFDGLAGALADVFGAPVIWTPAGGAPVTVQGVFREVPFDEDFGDGRAGLALMPVLRWSRTVAAGAAKGDTCTVAGRTFRLLRPVPSGSPAADSFVAWELEEI